MPAGSLREQGNAEIIGVTVPAPIRHAKGSVDGLLPTCRYPVSIKGVAVHNGRALPERNERDAWELPGGT